MLQNMLQNEQSPSESIDSKGLYVDPPGLFTNLQLFDIQIVKLNNSFQGKYRVNNIKVLDILIFNLFRN